MKLLMHMCCGPCSVFPTAVLQDEGIELEGIFFNPNIHPIDEHKKRRENVEKFSEHKGIPVTFMGDYMQEEWEQHKGTQEQRCRMCYSLRLDKTASFAKERGFDAFTTSLLVSPYQNHELIKELGEFYAKKYNIKFCYRDFRPGFRQGQQEARELDLYRQKFCGCIISYKESVNNKKAK